MTSMIQSTTTLPAPNHHMVNKVHILTETLAHSFYIFMMFNHPKHISRKQNENIKKITHLSPPLYTFEKFLK